MPRSLGEFRIHNRAMHRAMARLKELHRREYAELYEQELMAARREAAEHLQMVPAAHQHAQPVAAVAAAGHRITSRPALTVLPPVPPKLVTGPRPDGAPRFREDVGECPYCHRHHDRGHRCPGCGDRPVGGAVVRPAQFCSSCDRPINPLTGECSGCS